MSLRYTWTATFTGRTVDEIVRQAKAEFVRLTGDNLADADTRIDIVPHLVNDRMDGKEDVIEWEAEVTAKW